MIVRRTSRDDSVVSGIDVDWLIQWKRYVATDNRLIDSRVECGDSGLSQTGNELVYPTNTLSTDCRVSRTVTIPKV